MINNTIEYAQNLQKYTWMRIGISLVLMVSLFLNLKIVQAETSAANYYVAATGTDNANCGTSGAPCRSIQAAVNKAVTGDTILVAAGSYNYNGAADTCSFLVTRSVVCVVDKDITIRGGYTTSNWGASNPSANLTVIDGSERPFAGQRDRGCMGQFRARRRSVGSKQRGRLEEHGFQKQPRSGSQWLHGCWGWWGGDDRIDQGRFLQPG
jgi:hypothetical protein